MRRILCAAVLAAMLPTGVALAGPAKVACNLIVDARGDDGYDGAGPSDPALDVVSGDVASNGQWVTVILRLASLSLPAATSPAGVNYTFSLSTGEQTLEFLAATSAAAAPRYELRTTGRTGTDMAFAVTPSALPVTVVGSMSTASGELRMSVRRADAEKHTTLRLGRSVSRFQAFSWRTIPAVVDTVIASADEATSDASYRLGQRSCVTPGPRT